MKIVAILCATAVAALTVSQARADDCSFGSYCSHNTNSFPGGSGGVLGESTTSGTGVLGVSSTGYGLYGASNTGVGVNAYSNDGHALHARSVNAPGIYAESISTTAGSNGVEGHAYRAGVSGVYGVNGTNGYGVTGRISPAGAGTAVYGDNNNTSGWAGYFNGRLFASSGYKPGGGSWTSSSDARLKKEVKGLEGGLDRLLKLRGVTFKWIEPAKQGNLEEPQIGMIAQEVEKVFPEWVGRDAEGYRTLTFRGFEALTVEGMRTLNKDNQALRLQVESLEERIKKLETNPSASMAGFGSNSLAAVGAIALAVSVFLTSRRRAAS